MNDNEILETREILLRIPVKFWNTVLEEDGDRMNWSCKGLRSIILKQGGKKHYSYKNT